MKAITNKEKQELLSLDRKKLSVTKITQLFACTTKINEDFSWEKVPPKFDTKSVLHLDAGEYINIKAVDTTVGSFLFNKLFIEGTIESLIPNHYFNDVVDKKGFKKLTSIISEGLMMEKLPVDPNLIEWLRYYEFYALKLSTLFSPSYTEGLLKSNSSVTHEKNKILKGKKITSPSDMTDIEDALVEKSREILKKDPGMTLYTSGARGAFDNDYKNMNLILGPVAIPGKDGEFDMAKSNYIEGIQKEDLIAAANSVVNATHPKSVGTQVSGARTKEYYAAYQSLQLDVKGTDCGATMGISLVLTENNISKYHYQYVIGKKGPELITPDNQSKYLNKKVVVRSPMCCKGDKVCNICAGNRFYTIGIENVGLTAGRVPNNMLNAGMKNFHIAKVNFDDVDVNNLLI